MPYASALLIQGKCALCDQCVIHASFPCSCRREHLINTETIILTSKSNSVRTITFSQILCGSQMVTCCVIKALAFHSWGCWQVISLFPPFGGFDFSVLGIWPVEMSGRCFGPNGSVFCARKPFFFSCCQMPEYKPSVAGSILVVAPKLG